MFIVGFIITLMWLFGVVFLKNFYEISKETDARQIQSKVVSTLSKGDMADGYLKVIELSRRNDLFVLVYDEYGNLAYHPFLYFDQSSGRVRMNVEEIISSYNMGQLVSNFIKSGKDSYSTKMGDDKKQQSNIVLINKFTNNGLTYYALMRSPLVPVEATSEILTRILLMTFLFVFAVSLIISFVLSDSITNPIIKLSGATRMIAKGDYSVKLPENRSDEIGILQKDFNRMTEELSKVDNIRKDLIANVSHELRTPLTLIKGYAEAIKDISGNNPEKRNNQLEIIIDESDRLSYLISNMLDLSKLQAGKVEFYRQDVNISEKLKKLLNRYEIYKDMGYEFEYNIADDIYALCDEGRIEQVILNLIDNALNHSVETKKIYVELNDKKIFKVKNFGDVIDKKDLPFIWDRYYKIDKSGNRRVAGTGIGLSIVKEILTAHGFKFGVTSNETEGTTFWIDFSL